MNIVHSPTGIKLKTTKISQEEFFNMHAMKRALEKQRVFVQMKLALHQKNSAETRIGSAFISLLRLGE